MYVLVVDWETVYVSVVDLAGCVRDYGYQDVHTFVASRLGIYTLVVSWLCWVVWCAGGWCVVPLNAAHFNTWRG